MSRMAREDYFWAYFMIAPTMLGLIVFYIWPVFQTVFFSFTEWGDFGKYEWAGLVNYETMLRDTELWGALKNTLVYTFLMVPSSIAISILVAVLLNQKIHGIAVYRTLYFLPVVTMPVAVAMVWGWLYNGDYGLINNLLSQLTVQGPRWITDPNIALYSIVIVGVWSSIGYNMVIFISGLQGIPGSLYEAASIDGAGPIQKFFRITLPMLTPTIFFVAIITLIHAFQVFDLIFMMIDRDNIAIDKTQSLVYLFYEYAFYTYDKGYAAAIAILLFFIIMVVTVFQVKYQKKWVHYQ
jgi:multiple sugar transport system permease protein